MYLVHKPQIGSMTRHLQAWSCFTCFICIICIISCTYHASATSYVFVSVMSCPLPIRVTVLPVCMCACVRTYAHLHVRGIQPEQLTATATFLAGSTPPYFFISVSLSLNFLSIAIHLSVVAYHSCYILISTAG